MKPEIMYIINRLIAGESDIEKIKRDASKKFSLSGPMKNTEIIRNFPKNKLTREIKALLLRKPMRTLSGVSPIAVMIKPIGSCKGKCIYCPYTGKAPKSYTGEEPAARRARSCGFDPFLQVKIRLKQYKLNGHPTDKCEVILMGGTFLQTPLKYQKWFVKRLYDGLNGTTSKSLEEAKKRNERAKNRMVGLTIETRPDVFGKKELDQVLEFGGTRIEFGVQYPEDEMYKKIKRGHTVQDVVEATERAKNAGLKVCYHLMLGLPGSNKKRDIQMIGKIFSKEEFKPDMLKIYPTLVIKGTELWKMKERGEYKPLDTEETIEILSELYKIIPPYVRIMRIQRDIPSPLINEGVRKSNLRQILEQRMKNTKTKSNEIRFKEIGLLKGKLGKTKIKRIDYKASGGKEIFIYFENEEGLMVGFIRMRVPKIGKEHRKEITPESAIIRELHVYGKEEEISKKGKVQHAGFGNRLLGEAEQIAKKEFGKKKMVVISGVGVREYYYKFGYKKEGAYVSKKL